MRGRPVPRNPWRPANLIALSLLFGLAFAAGLGFGAWRAVLPGLPDVERLEERRPPPATRFYDRNGSVIADFASEPSEAVPLEALPPMLVWALVAEDPAFYRHAGIDHRRLVSTALRRFARRSDRGATTITMRYAGVLLPEGPGSVRRKLEEMALAREIESRYSKPRILELFLNQAYFGSGAYGIEAAARAYFDKPASDLELAESTLLIGTLESPATLDPRLNPAGARARRAEVLDALVDLGYDREAAERVKAEEIRLAPPDETGRSEPRGLRGAALLLLQDPVDLHAQRLP